MGMRPAFYQMKFDELRALCEERGLPPTSADLLFNWHFKKNRRETCAHHNLSPKASAYFRERVDFSLPKIKTAHLSEDKTVKFLFELHDGSSVETVLIPFNRKYTVCLSSQVGCAMNCSFCFTGKQGFTRHLRTEEIVGQFLEAQRWLTSMRPGDDRILNVVYMGQGEPLHNFDAVKKSAEIFLSQRGVSLAPHKITVSTSGYVPGLQRWREEMPNVNIALSLHSPFSETRSKLIPINRRYPLQDVLALLDEIPHDPKRFVTYEYLLIDGVNDSDADAEETGRLLKGRKAFINLIPFNKFPGSPYERPELARIRKFKSILDTFEIPTLIRTTKGDRILAACGQLNTAIV
jgi:23S rRNA (adenine2503-C2)-methyltransferase